MSQVLRREGFLCVAAESGYLGCMKNVGSVKQVMQCVAGIPFAEVERYSMFSNALDVGITPPQLLLMATSCWRLSLWARCENA